MFWFAADAHDAGHVVLAVAACFFKRAADAHDAGVFLPLLIFLSRLMLMMLGLLRWTWRLVF